MGIDIISIFNPPKTNPVDKEEIDREYIDEIYKELSVIYENANSGKYSLQEIAYQIDQIREMICEPYDDDWTTVLF